MIGMTDDQLLEHFKGILPTKDNVKTVGGGWHWSSIVKARVLLLLFKEKCLRPPAVLH